MTGPPEGHVGDLAVVLHSHMPYVEGFGTYPFGEEWLFDAYARSHLPVLEVARNVTISVTPVLADQLEAPGVPERMAAFLREHRLRAAERDAASGAGGAAAGAEAMRYRRAVERIEELDGDLLAPFRDSQRTGRVALLASAATHAVLPLIATTAVRRLQLDAGLRSHSRRFGATRGLWLPECAYEPGLERLLADVGIEHFCADQSGHEPAADSLTPVRTGAGVLAFTIDWDGVSLVWSERGYPSAAEYLDFHRISPNGIRLWAIGGGAYDPDEAARRAVEDAERFVDHLADRLATRRAERGVGGLATFAIDTELLGHWWTEGPAWLDAVLRLARKRGIRPLTLPDARAAHAGETRPLRASSWGEGKDLRTWDSPRVADLTWAVRRLELRLLRAVAAPGLNRAGALRAARELLAVQASDWAFLDSTRRAGDYPYARAVNHAQRMLEAIHSSNPPDPRMRNLSPDLDLAPLLEP